MTPENGTRRVEVLKKANGIVFTTDRTLLKIVLNQMLRNALEAVPVGQTVTIGADYLGRNVGFGVHNPGAMPRDIQLQVFQRSFTTKGEGRGLGTYMMRLLCERYLGGHVTFETSEEKGTVFQAILPMELGVLV